MDDFIEKKDFDNKLKKINKNVSANKTEHIEVQKKLTDLQQKLKNYQENGTTFWEV